MSTSLSPASGGPSVPGPRWPRPQYSPRAGGQADRCSVGRHRAPCLVPISVLLASPVETHDHGLGLVSVRCFRE